MHKVRKVGSAKRVLIYSYLLTSAFGVAVGLLMAFDEWGHGLTLSFAIASGVAACVAAMRDELADDLRRLFRERPRAQRAYGESVKPALTRPHATESRSGDRRR